MLRSSLVASFAVLVPLVAACGESARRSNPGPGACTPWRPEGGDFASVATARPPIMTSPSASAGGQWLYSVGHWVEPDGMQSGLLRSPDLGATFCVVPTPEAPDVVMPSPASATVVYLLTPLDEGGARAAYRSNDAGASFTLVTPPPAGGSLAASLLDPDVLWSLAPLDGLALTTDGMQTWTSVTLPPDLAGGASQPDQGGLLQRVVVDPASPARLLVQGIVFDQDPSSHVGYAQRMFASADAGASWVEIVPPGFADLEPAWAYSLVADVASTLFYSAGGLLSTSADWGATWSAVGPLPDPGAQLVDLSPPSAGRLFVQASDTKYWESTDGGASWEAIATPDPSFWPLVAPAGDAGVLVGNVTSSIVATRDGGRSWRAAPPVPLPYVLVSSPVEPHPLWEPTLGLRSRDGGRSWRKVPLPEQATLLPDGARADTVYAYSLGQSTLERSEDAGDTWTPLTPPPDFGAVAGMASCPPPSSCLYLLYSESRNQPFPAALRRSDDGGRSWSDARPTPESWFYEPNAMVVDPNDHDHLAVAGGDGLAESHDGGLTWTSQAMPGGVGSIALLRDGTMLVTSVPQGPIRQTSVSSDGGETWAQVLDTAGTLLTTASRPSTVLALAGGIYRSDDSGRTWARVSPEWLESSALSFSALAEAPGGRFVASSPDFGLVGFE